MSDPNESPVHADSENLSYAKAGVDIDAGNALVENIKPLVKRTLRPGVLGGLGGFGGLFEIPQGYQEHVLVSGTDGVGTKLKLAMQLQRHDTIGIDLVAMCVNDIVVAGAEPLFFLDYYATGKLAVETATQVVEGIASGCELAGCALIGGETAEMPGMYQDGDYDLAGFAVGIVEKSRILPADQVKPGDVLLGLQSSGPHSNGYSLVRKLVERSGLSWADQSPFSEGTLGQALLAPTRLYVKQCMSAIKAGGVHGFTHITGGGLSENIPRALNEGQGIEINLDAWELPAVFGWLQAQGGISDAEMLKTFNCGLGMVVIVGADQVAGVTAALEAAGETVYEIGTVTDTARVEYKGTLA